VYHYSGSLLTELLCNMGPHVVLATVYTAWICCLTGYAVRQVARGLRAE
jgi:hypothetical protein